jgi:hypothetical protein
MASDETGERPGNWGLVAASWLAVGLPLLWGVWSTVQKAVQLFR